MSFFCTVVYFDCCSNSVVGIRFYERENKKRKWLHQTYTAARGLRALRIIINHVASHAEVSNLRRRYCENFKCERSFKFF